MGRTVSEPSRNRSLLRGSFRLCSSPQSPLPWRPGVGRETADRGRGTPDAPPATRVPEEIIFAVRQPGVGSHWYENFGYYAQDEHAKLYRAMGRLCRLNLRTRQAHHAAGRRQGRGPRSRRSTTTASKILFSYRKGGTDHFHLYEINADGTGLRQLTDGPVRRHRADLPARRRDHLLLQPLQALGQLLVTQVAILYRCDADGGNIRPISATSSRTTRPGRCPTAACSTRAGNTSIAARSSFHHLWTVNPDGTGQMVFFGNLHPGTVMIDAKPIPGTDKVVAIFSPRHGQHGARRGGHHRRRPSAGPTTWARPGDQPGRRLPRSVPARRDCFLVAQGPRLLVMDGDGQTTEVYRLPAELAKAGRRVPRAAPAAASRGKPAILPRVSLGETTGRLILATSTRGGTWTGVQPRRDQEAPGPGNASQAGQLQRQDAADQLRRHVHLGADPGHRAGRGRRLGLLELPALRSLFFVALDEHDISVKRMQSFLTVMPGETTSCVGCHEQRQQDAAACQRTARCWPSRRRPAGSRRSPASPTCSTSPATSSRSSTSTACAATTTIGATAAWSSAATAARSTPTAITRSPCWAMFPTAGTGW